MDDTTKSQRENGLSLKALMSMKYTCLHTDVVNDFYGTKFIGRDLVQTKSTYSNRKRGTESSENGDKLDELPIKMSENQEKIEQESKKKMKEKYINLKTFIIVY